MNPSTQIYTNAKKYLTQTHTQTYNSTQTRIIKKCLHESLSVSIFRLRLTETSWDQLEVEVATLPFPAFSDFLPWAVGTLSAGCVRLCPGTVVTGSAHPSPFFALEGLQCGSLPCFALSLPYGKSQCVWGRSWPKLANCSWIWGYCHLWLCLARAWHLAERPPSQASRGPRASSL